MYSLIEKHYSSIDSKVTCVKCVVMALSVRTWAALIYNNAISPISFPSFPVFVFFVNFIFHYCCDMCVSKCLYYFAPVVRELKVQLSYFCL